MRTPLAALFCLLLTRTPALAGNRPPSIVLTAQENGTVPQTEFYCSGKIKGYIRLSERQEGNHVLEGIWTLPSGRVLRHSRDPVNFPPPGRSTAYVWFAFPDKPALLLSPDTNVERPSYPGIWRLQVRWDEKPLLSSTFTVHCQ